MDDALTRLLERRVQRDPSTPVDRGTVEVWCAQFGDAWPEATGDRVPTLMFPTFVRPSAPPRPGEAAATGVVLHDELKRALDLPVAIAVGCELRLDGPLHLGDSLVSVERIAEVGDERATRFGPGREWIIEVATTTTEGVSVGVERFRMLGYRPGESGGDGARPVRDAIRPQWSEDVSFDVAAIVRAATANHVWATAHHDGAAARAAGLPDVILDTSSQIALLAGAAQRRRPSTRIRSVDLTMKRPILPGAAVRIGGIELDDRTTVVATVDDREVSRAHVEFDA